MVWMILWMNLYVPYQLLLLLFSDHWPLATAHDLLSAARCFLRAAHCEMFFSKHPAKRTKKPVFRISATHSRPSANLKTPSAPKRNSPAQAPGHIVFAIPYALMGACAGEGLAGGGLEGPASP